MSKGLISIRHPTPNILRTANNVEVLIPRLEIGYSWTKTNLTLISYTRIIVGVFLSQPEIPHHMNARCKTTKVHVNMRLTTTKMPKPWCRDIVH